MRIIQGHDYYDIGLSYGVDPSVVLVRDSRRVDFKEIPLPRVGCLPNIRRIGEKRPWIHDQSTWWHGHRSVSVSTVHVIFAGRYYSGVRVNIYTGYAPQPDRFDVFWDRESLDKHLRRFCDAYVEKDRKQNRWVLKYEKSRGEPEREPFVSYELTDDAKTYVFENRVALAYTEHEGRDLVWIVNGDNLKYQQFYKVKDAYTAFQDLSMFVGGVLPRQGNPMVEIVDQKVKIQKAGFDTKTSFRHPVKIPRRKDKAKVDSQS